MSAELEQFEAWLTLQTERVAVEEAHWDSLELRARGLAERSARLVQILEDAQRRAGGLFSVLSDPPPAVEGATALVSTATSALQSVADPAAAFTQQMGEDSLLAEAVAGVQVEVEAFASTVESSAADVAAEVEALLAQLTQAAPDALAEAASELVGVRETAVETFEETMRAGLEDTLDDSADALDRISTALGEACEAVCESLVTHADGVLSDTDDLLENQRASWNEGLDTLGNTYETLGQDLERLGTDLRELYRFVAQGMDSSGIGMTTGAEALNTVRQLMGGVA